MIVPVGKRRKQVNQGLLSNQHINNDDMFSKLAQGAASLIDDRKPNNHQEPSHDPSNELQQATMDGGLNGPGQADRHEQGVDERNPAPQSTQAVAPAGGAPADAFIGPAQVDPNDQSNNPFEAEVQRIRQFIGYQHYGLDIKPQGSDGSLEVTIIPPPGQPVDIGQLMAGLKQVTQGQWMGEKTPSMTSGGPIVLKYVPQSMATTNKVEKQ